MSEKPEKSKLTVQYKPIGEGAFFDVKPPANSVPEFAREENQRFGELSRFFLMAFSIFLVFTFVSIVVNGRELVHENKNIAFAGFDDLRAGVNAMTSQDFGRASAFFEGAEHSFEEISQNLRYLTAQANRYLKTDLYLDAAEKLIESGVAVSKIGQELTEVVKGAQSIPQIFIQQNLQGDESVRLTDLVYRQKIHLDSIVMEAKLLQNNLATINAGALPNDLRQVVEKAQVYIGDFLAALLEIDHNFEVALSLLGDKVPHRYLVLLQNNHEIRATGGFIGSYIIIDVNDGAITKMETKDIYDTDGQLSDIVAPPPGISQVSDQLYMRDANYSPDFPTSAQDLMWFLEHSRGPTVDTVIAIDQTIAEKLLELTGPVTLENFPFQIRADNFNELFSFHIESKLSKTATPKQLLVDFIPVFKDRLLSLNDFSRLNDTVNDLISARHIQVYSNDSGIQELVDRLHLDGRMIAPAPNIDYLAIVSTSIGGNKSDAFIKTNLSHHTEVDYRGGMVDHLTIQKTHTWKEEDFVYWKKLISRYGTGNLHEKTLRFIHGEGDNTDYMRVYTPKGSRLVGLEGVDVENLASFEDLGYTVFAFTFGPIPAGQTKTVQLSYKLPHSLQVKTGDIYRFVIQKQAGSENINFVKSLEASDYLQVLQTYPVTPESAFTLYPKYETELDQNQIFLSAIAGR